MSPVALVVEDDPGLQAALRSCLESDGWEVAVASDGRSVFLALDTVKPDLILLDITLPDMDGWEVNRHLKAHPTAHRVPVVGLSGLGGASFRDSAIETLGFADYLEKPFEMEDLLARLRELLEADSRPA